MPQEDHDPAVLAAAKNNGIAAFVLGILALLSCFTGIGSIFGLIMGIIGMVLGNRARKALPRAESGLATAGWICSIIAVSLCGLAFIAAMFFLGSIFVI